MRGISRYFLSAVLLASIVAIGGCSRDEPDPPSEPGEPREQASNAGVARPPGGAGKADPGWSSTLARAESEVSTESGNFVLHVRNGSYLSSVLPDLYRERCLTGDGDERECGFLRRLLIVEVTMALEEIERSRDQRGTQQALAALDLDQEPMVLVAAMRVLGRFPDTPGIAEKVQPLLLESPWLSVQQMSAQLLAANPDPTLAAVGSHWDGNHNTLYAENVYQEYPDFAPHYLEMDFPEYADADWFSPADSDRSVGWWTDDDLATVSAWLTDELGVEGLTYQDWAQHLAQESQAMFQVDPDKQAEVQRLIEEWTRTQDMAVLEKMQKLQEELYAPAQAAGEIADKGVGSLGPAMTPDTLEQARFYIAEERAGHVARLVIAYPLTSLGRTVIQHAWNLTDYPSAWPPVEEQE